MPSSLPPWVRDLSRRDLWLRRLRSVGLGSLLLVDAVYASGGFDGRRRAAEGLPVAMSDTASGIGMLIALLGMALMVAVAWRQRWPVVLTLVGCAATLVQLGPTAALIGLMSVVICRPLVDAYRGHPHRRRRLAWGGGAALQHRRSGRLTAARAAASVPAAERPAGQGDGLAIGGRVVAVRGCTPKPSAGLWDG